MKTVYYGESNIGKIRLKNEDSFVLEKVWGVTHLLAVVVDGVGGNFGGDVAAALTSRCIREHINGTTEYSNEADVLKAAVIYANNSIISQQRIPVLNRMSCVMTAVLLNLCSGVMNVCHVGDTRLYLLENNNLIKLTSDHSLVGPLEETGQLSEIQAMIHPRRNIITRSLGNKPLQLCTDYLQTLTIKLNPCSLLLLCSDGLYDMITSVLTTEIIMKKNLSVQKRTQQLINAALDAGGKDNVTVCLISLKE